MADAPSAVPAHYLAGKVAVVTGGRGIGRAITRAFVKECHRVLRGHRRFSVHGFGTDVDLDVTSEASVDALFTQIDADHGQLDILVNAAGVEIEKP